MTIDEKTGLPELTEGRVWRITDAGDGRVDVAIIESYTFVYPERQERRWWKTVTIPERSDERRFTVARDTCKITRVRECAANIVNRLDICGYYPPKRLPDE